MTGQPGKNVPSDDDRSGHDRTDQKTLSDNYRFADSLNAAPGRPSTSGIRWMIVMMLMGFTFLGHFNRVSISVAGAEKFIGPHGMTKEQMGWVYSAFLFVYTVMMLPGGWVIDRIGTRLALTGMGLGMGACVVLTGLLGWSGLTIAGLWIPLLLIRGIAGSLSVPLHPGAARSVSLWLPISSRSTGNGFVTAGALIGISVAYPGFGWLMDQLGWANAFIVCGSVMMVFSLMWYAFSADGPHQHPRTSDAERRLIDNGSTLQVRQTSTIADFFRMFRNRGLLLLTVSYAAVSYFQYLFFYWIEFYFESELKLPVTESRNATFYVMMAMAAGMAGGGFLSDSLSRILGHRWGYRLVAIAGMGLSALFAWLGMGAAAPGDIVQLFALALGSLGMCEGLFWTTAPALEPRNGGLACAFLNTVGNAGGLIAPILTPWIGTNYSWMAAMNVACVVCLAGSVLWLGIDPEKSSA